MTAKHTLGRNERLKSRKIIEQLFKDGRAVSAFPVRISYLLLEAGSALAGSDLPVNDVNPGAILQAGFSASSRNFKKATDRNWIKRLLRETYRKQKAGLFELLKESDRQLAIFIIFTGKELPEYAFLEEKMKLAIKKLLEQLSSKSAL